VAKNACKPTYLRRSKIQGEVGINSEILSQNKKKKKTQNYDVDIGRLLKSSNFIRRFLFN
jgi:hypothetical protein